MSQLPSNNEIPGNSQKEQNKPQKPEVTPFEGEVAGVKRNKTGFWAWFRKMFLSDRKPKDIMMDVLENQIVPGIKDNVRNSVVSSIDMFVYQSAKPPQSQNAANNSVSYNNIFRASTAPQRNQQQKNEQASEDAEKNGQFSNPCFKSIMDARNFLNSKMKAYDFPTLSVHTLYMMRNKRIDYTWDAYGWTREEILALDETKCIVPTRNREWPYMIALPQAHVIN